MGRLDTKRMMTMNENADITFNAHVAIL